MKCNFCLIACVVIRVVEIVSVVSCHNGSTLPLLTVRPSEDDHSEWSPPPLSLLGDEDKGKYEGGKLRGN